MYTQHPPFIFRSPQPILPQQYVLVNYQSIRNPSIVPHQRGLTQEKKNNEQQNKQSSQPQSNLTESKTKPKIVHEKSSTVQPYSFGKKNNHKLKEIVSSMERMNNNDSTTNGGDIQIHCNQNAAQRMKSDKYYIDDLITSFQDENVHFAKQFRDNFTNSFNFIPSIKNIKFDETQIQAKKIQLNEYPQNLKYKKTVVFDLDETLVHCNEDENTPSQIYLPITFPTGETVNAGINIRPFAEKMIKMLSDVCEVMIFTASHECYANEVINYIDPEKRVSKRIYRDSCVTVGEENYYIKNLEVLDRDLKDIVLVDNASYSFVHHLENGIPIISYYDDKNDSQLIKLHRFLLNKILPANDVRPIIKEYFKLDQIDQYQNIVESVEKMYCIV